MNEIRYIDEAYPLFICLDEKKFNETFHKQVKASKDFVAFMPKDAFETAKHYEEFFEKEKIVFALLYATKEGVIEMGDYLSNCGFGKYIKIAPNYTLKLKQPMPVYADYRDLPQFKEWLKNRNKEYNDILKIEVATYNKIYDVINPLVESKRILMSDLIDGDKLPFPKVSILIGSENFNIITNFAYQKESKKLFVEQYTTDTKRNVLKLVHEIDEPYDSEKKLSFNSNVIYKGDMLSDSCYFPMSILGDTENNYLTNTLWQFFYINYFVRTLPTCYVKHPRKEIETWVKGKGINKTTKSKVVIKTEYTFNIMHYSTKHIRHIFKCLCWSVRGHYRHLKNGQVIFVQSYRKGKERNNLNAFVEKEYVI